MKPYYYQRKSSLYGLYRELICQALGIDEFDLLNAVFDCGLEYVDEAVKEQAGRISILYSGDFWRWWVNQWNLRNEDFVLKYQLYQLAGEKMSYGTSVALFNQYFTLHECQLYNKVTHASFANLVSKITSRNELSTQRA
jgi:hypothetical protein